MRSIFCRQSLAVTFTFALLLGGAPSLAGPVELPPAEVDGKITPYSRVKKFGKIWYPASLVGHHRGINFSYDYATRTLYANGEETHIPALVVDDIVYLNMTPQVTQGDMRPGMNSLVARREELMALEGASSHMSGNTQARLMAENISTQAHPWAQGSAAPESPLIDLDPSQEAHMAAHMRPGARPSEAPPAALPNRLPLPGEALPPDLSAQTVVIPPTLAAGTIPVQVRTQGGPDPQIGVVPDPNGLQPIPVPVAPTKTVAPFATSGNVKAASGQNSVFKVNVASGTWEVADSGNLLRLKLSQTNLSRVAQSNLGSFAVRCEDGSRVEASRTRSYLPDGTLGPNALREGELIFRLDKQKAPRSLELEGALPLSVTLQQAP